jgi:hypothetical protein
VRTELKVEIAPSSKSRSRPDRSRDRVQIEVEIASVRDDLFLVEHRLLTRLDCMIVAATGILVAIHYIH